MRRLILSLTLGAVLCGVHPAVSAKAVHDVRVDTEKDDKRNTIFKLVNSATRPIVAEVEHVKKCSSVTTNQPPRVRTYLVHAGKSVQLRKVWAESNCEHRFRIVAATYYEES